jgi:DnaJ-class molecular chaperone
MKIILTWILFWVFGKNKCKSCKGSGDSNVSYGDGELFGSSSYFPCEACHGTGTTDGTTRIPQTVHTGITPPKPSYNGDLQTASKEALC